MHLARVKLVVGAGQRLPVTSTFNMRQNALAAPVPDRLSSGASTRAAGRALPAELLPYAAAQLLPLWLLPPERVRALELPHLMWQVSDFLSAVLVSSRLIFVRPLEPCLCAMLSRDGMPGACLCGRAGRLRQAGGG